VNLHLEPLNLLTALWPAPAPKVAIPKETAPPISAADVPGFREFIKNCNKKYRFFWHCEKLIDVLERVERGELKRVMVFMPPRHGKSELVSRLFSAWFVMKHPDWFVGLASYGQDLADQLSRAAQNNFIANGGALDSANVRNWTTVEGGGMWCAGVGGPITGKGAHLLIVDDPLKGEEDSNSPTQRAKLLEWYDAVFTTREEPWSEDDQTTPIIIVQTRWHEEDLAGALLDRERESFEDEDDPDRWHIVVMEGIKEEEPYDLPSTCTIEPDERKPGEPLCPERRSLKWLERLKRRWKAGYWWAALFQQRPRPIDGTYIKREYIKYVNERPELDKWIRFYDTALTKGGDSTGTGLIGNDGRKVYLDFLQELHEDTPELREFMRARVKDDPPGTQIAVESSTASLNLIQDLKNDPDFEGVVIHEVKVKGRTKIARALGWITRLALGEFLFVRGSWNMGAIEVLCRFKGEDKDSDNLPDGISTGFEALYWRAGGKTENEKRPKEGTVAHYLQNAGFGDEDDTD